MPEDCANAGSLGTAIHSHWKKSPEEGNNPAGPCMSEQIMLVVVSQMALCLQLESKIVEHHV
jgi:hypothetical protein